MKGYLKGYENISETVILNLVEFILKGCLEMKHIFLLIIVDANSISRGIKNYGFEI